MSQTRPTFSRGLAGSVAVPARLTASGVTAILSRLGSAQVAQLVEHVTENHGVDGSIPPLGTT